MPAMSEKVREAYELACLTELRALKPGNVHLHAAGHGMSVKDFEASCEASAPEISRPGLSVGQRILRAVRATREAVGCNTNLGIVLLAAPLAQAALDDTPAPLRDCLRQVLDSLDVADAADAYEAIRLASPGGLGESSKHDVGTSPSVSLREAMAEAADRDMIARQYVTCYEDIFAGGLPTLRRMLARWHSLEWAASAVYLEFLSRFPDSHVARKFGPGVADDLRRRAARHCSKLLKSDAPGDMSARLIDFDTRLKAEDLNPGTSADLCVATIFAEIIDVSGRNKITGLL